MSSELVSAYKALDMEDIAKGNIPTTESVNQVKTQLYVFLVAQAQRELMRIIRLTETLDLIQNRYEDCLTDAIYSWPDAELVQVLPDAINTLIKSVNNANNIISKVFGNDKVMNFQILAADNNSTINIGNTQTNQEILNLQNAESRKKVRDAVSSILNNIQNMEEVEGAESDK